MKSFLALFVTLLSIQSAFASEIELPRTNVKHCFNQIQEQLLNSANSSLVQRSEKVQYVEMLAIVPTGARGSIRAYSAKLTTGSTKGEKYYYRMMSYNVEVGAGCSDIAQYLKEESSDKDAIDANLEAVWNAVNAAISPSK